ncbi:nuclear factor 7, brain-like [Boleophthalmus pectinirostris]|uniref:nuclear factor 7, brain-like n=1 Tax=Boleophthalmus pectinirostris TaxID=150288 RepID=UPI000A1C5F1E|nr:nuclear factor 7, brain-like [Boleophthalmus pectinirostris]
MASQSEEELCCPICQDIYTDPIVLSCSHSFCGVCLEDWWKTKETKECPLCMKNISEDPTIQEAKQQPLNSVCKIHSEELKLFCTDHQQPVCLVCRDSEKHTGHKFRPITEAAPICRNQLDEELQTLKKKRQDMTESKDKLSATEIYIQNQVEHTERQIQKQFRMFQAFLEEEEEVRIQAVREEGETKRKKFQDKMAAMTEEIESLSKIIAETEEQLKATDVFFLLQYKDVEEKLQHCALQEEPQLEEPGALVDQAKHLGNLAFNIWTNMKSSVQFYPVILDPNTAHPELALSEDLTSLSFAERQKLPGNPERFEMYRWVVGSEGMSSGSHSWDVEVSGDSWTVGVVSGNVERKGQIMEGVWKIFLYHGKYFAFSPPDPVRSLTVKKKLQRVRVGVDFSRGALMFFDVSTKKCLHSFTRTFDEVLFPYFETFSPEQLKILPVQFSSIQFKP